MQDPDGAEGTEFGGWAFKYGPSRKATQDIVATGSASVVRTLMEHDLVDEYRLLVFPTVVGKGTRLFGEGTAPIGLELTSVEPADPTILLVYRRTQG